MCFRNVHANKQRIKLPAGAGAGAGAVVVELHCQLSHRFAL